jgi:hypothetical protein
MDDPQPQLVEEFPVQTAKCVIHRHIVLVCPCCIGAAGGRAASKADKVRAAKRGAEVRWAKARAAKAAAQ